MAPPIWKGKTMKTYTATVQHHSISRSRVVNLKTNNLTLAKRRATAEFGKGFNDHVIVIHADHDTAVERVVTQRRIDGEWY